MSKAGDWKVRALALLAQGVDPASIGERLGVARWSVQRVRRGMEASAGTLEDLPPQTWPALYAGGATLEQIVSRTGVSQMLVRRELAARGVTMRAPGKRR